jgi:hypothetical protein
LREPRRIDWRRQADVAEEAFLLADDTKIRDRTITSQIARL